MNELSLKVSKAIGLPLCISYLKQFASYGKDGVLKMVEWKLKMRSLAFYEKHFENHTWFTFSKIEHGIFKRNTKLMPFHCKVALADSKVEAIFFKMLCDEGVEFDFQVKIGKYRVDFLFDKLVLEIDGPRHNFKENIEYDAVRDQYLESKGYTVIRVSVKTVTINPKKLIKILNGLREKFN